MVQRSQDFGFTLKAADAIQVTRELFGQNFDCDVALQFRVACAIDLAHAALAENGSDFERTKSCAHIYRHWIINGDPNCLGGIIMPRSNKGSKPTSPQTMSWNGFHGVIDTRYS